MKDMNTVPSAEKKPLKERNAVPKRTATPFPSAADAERGNNSKMKYSRTLIYLPNKRYCIINDLRIKDEAFMDVLESGESKDKGLLRNKFLENCKKENIHDFDFFDCSDGINA